ncbi:MAG: phage tail terminator-like protein [Pseudomonadota bacterium]
MSFAAARNAIHGALSTGWSATPLASIHFDNVSFEPPDGDWLRITVEGNTARQVSLGPTGQRRMRRSGLIFIQVFTGAGKGPRDNDDILQAAATALEAQQIAGNGVTVHTQAATAPQGGSVEDGYWQRRITIPFYYDQTGV